MQTAYSIYEDSKDSRYGKIIVRLNQGKNTEESRDLIKTKTQEGLDSQVVGKPPFVVRDKDGKFNILINVVEMEKIENIKFKLGQIGFVLKGEDDLSQLVSQFDFQTKGGSRKYNKSSKTKKYKTTKNKKNKKSTKHKKTKKTKKNKKTLR